MTIRTIIPDIHADLDRLEASIAAANGAPIAFLGDFIDAGPMAAFHADDLGVLQRVRALKDEGRAIAVMGNHELNAILYHRRGWDGFPMREHTAKNTNQHSSFVEAFGVETPAAISWTDWMLEALPLWHDAADLRLIHAFWSPDDIAIVRARRADGLLRPEDLPEIAAESTPFGMAVNRLVSGIEATLPGGVGFVDKSGHLRHAVRLSWWRKNTTWRDAALSIPNRRQLPATDMPAHLAASDYPASAPPVFVGHYKMDGTPRLESPNVLCLDYPKTPCVYHWHGESMLMPEQLQTLQQSPMPSNRPKI